MEEEFTVQREGDLLTLAGAGPTLSELARLMEREITCFAMQVLQTKALVDEVHYVTRETYSQLKTKAEQEYSFYQKVKSFITRANSKKRLLARRNKEKR